MSLTNNIPKTATMLYAKKNLQIKTYCFDVQRINYTTQYQATIHQPQKNLNSLTFLNS
jgi:hypothetical protein